MTQGKIDKNKFMTLENTVDLLIDAVNQHYDVDRVLTDFGIRVLGTRNYSADIPGNNGNIEDRYQGKFGDAYLVSQNHDGQAPWDIWIWTRLTPDAVEPEGYWLSIGELTAKGAQGDTGDPGPQGPQGENTRWYIYRTLPQSGDFKPGDVCLLPNGDVYMYVSPEYGWSNATQVNIKGQPGTPGADGQTPYIGPNGTWWIGNQNTGVRAEGRDGDVGTPGTAILIQGKLSSATLLPPAATAPRNYGYLIEVDGVVRLYFIAGMEGEENWQYIEYSGNGTIVTTDGTALDTWDTNTKVNRRNYAYVIYATGENGEQTAFSWTTGKQYNGCIPRCDNSGHQHIVEPASDDHPTTKKYVDDLAATKLNKINTPARVYTTNTNGESSSVEYSSAVKKYTMMYRYTDGRCKVGEPVTADDCATKKYVDTAVAAVGGGDYITKIVTIQSEIGQNAILNITDLPDIVPNTIVDVVATINFTGLTSSPSSISQLGTTYAASGSYDGLPYFSSDMNHWMGRLNQNGSMFFASVNQGIPGVSGASGNEFTIGTTQSSQASEPGGQTTLTVKYTAFS